MNYRFTYIKKKQTEPPEPEISTNSSFVVGNYAFVPYNEFGRTKFIDDPALTRMDTFTRICEDIPENLTFQQAYNKLTVPQISDTGMNDSSNKRSIIGVSKLNFGKCYLVPSTHDNDYNTLWSYTYQANPQRIYSGNEFDLVAFYFLYLGKSGTTFYINNEGYYDFRITVQNTLKNIYKISENEEEEEDTNKRPISSCHNLNTYFGMPLKNEIKPEPEIDVWNQFKIGKNIYLAGGTNPISRIVSPDASNPSWRCARANPSNSWYSITTPRFYISKEPAKIRGVIKDDVYKWVEKYPTFDCNNGTELISETRVIDGVEALYSIYFKYIVIAIPKGKKVSERNIFT